MGLKEYFAKPDKPKRSKTRGYKGWTGELEPTAAIGYWELTVKDPDGKTWLQPGKRKWSIYGPGEKNAIVQARAIVKRVADKQIEKAEWEAKGKKIV